MGIVELLAAVGDDRIKFQNLDACTIQADWSRGAGTKITFGTGEPLGPNGTASLGLVVWLPRDEVKRILAALPVEGGVPYRHPTTYCPAHGTRYWCEPAGDEPHGYCSRCALPVQGERSAVLRKKDGQDG